MNTLDYDETPPRLSLLDIRILVALSKCEMSAYQIARTAEDDSTKGLKVSNGGMYYALRRLEARQMIVKKANIYSITGLGRQFLDWELADLRVMAATGKARLRQP